MNADCVKYIRFFSLENLFDRFSVIFDWTFSTEFSFLFFQQLLPPRVGSAEPNSTNCFVPENALDALLDELQTFAKPSELVS